MSDYDRYFGRGELNERVDAVDLVEEIGLDDEEIEWRKSFIDFDEDDAERLERFEEPFDAHADEIADSFYDHLTDFESTREIFDRSEKTVEQLKLTQKAYLQTLADGTYDESYFRNRARIGKLHELLEMPIKHYVGQYNVYYSLLLSLITERIHDRLEETVTDVAERDGELGDAFEARSVTQRLSADVEEGIDELHSLLKLLNLDMQVAVDTYIQSHVDDLELERDRFAALFENVPTPVVSVRLSDDGEEIEQVNTAFEELFGYTAEDLSDRSFERALQPDDAEPRSISGESVFNDLELSEGKQLDEVELTLETKFGRREFVRVSALIDRPGFADHEYEYAFYIDVTDQKQRQQRLQVLSRVLRHDIRTQMNLVKGYSSSITETDDEERRDWMAQQIETASDELLSMSDRIRKIERLVAGHEDRHPVEVRPIVEETLEEASQEYPECEFTRSIPEPLSVTATDSVRIALKHVVENGAKHNDASDPHVEVSAVESLDGDHVDVRIADNGPGIPPAEYEVLTGERDRSQTEHVSGLGLWTVNWIITKFGGSLQFDANTPRGSIVTVRLPRADRVES